MSKVHSHSIGQGLHEDSDPPAILFREFSIDGKAIIQPLEQNSFGRVLLERHQRRLESAGDRVINRVGIELPAEIAKILRAPVAIDQVTVRDSVRRPRKEIRQPHLIAHVPRQHIQGEIKRPRHLFKDLVKQFLPGGLGRRGRAFSQRTSSLPSIPFSR